MGIFCHINLFKPIDGAYQPGQSVSGLIKYAVDEPMKFNKITTSLKGNGTIDVVEKGNKRDTTYYNKEVYIDLDNVIHDENVSHPVGAYEIKFNFDIPLNIPPSTNISKTWADYTLDCQIVYYIRIKFQRPGFFARNKHYKKDITIISGITPKLLREPVIYGRKKKPMQLFSNKENYINIKATILKSVIPIGGKIQLHYKVENRSSSLVKSVKIKLIEVYRFISLDGDDLELPEDEVPDTYAKTPAILCGDTQIMPIEINIPSNIHSLEHSNIVSREYQVSIEVALPMPHRNIVLTIPVQIGTINDEKDHNTEGSSEQMSFNDPPPSYWEAMGETTEEGKDGSNNESNNEKYKLQDK